VLGLADSI